MKIVDLNGCLIEVPDLDKAIRITTRYKKYKHLNKRFSELDKNLNEYWTDINEKLLKLKSKTKLKS